MLAMVFVAIHILTSILDTYVHIGFLAIVIPLTSPYGRFWVGVGTVAFDLMLAVFISSLLRSRMRPGTWRGLHWLAYGSWPVALAHTFGMGTDAGELWVIALGGMCVLAVGVALVWRLNSTKQRPAPPARRVSSSALAIAGPTRGSRHDA